MSLLGRRLRPRRQPLRMLVATLTGFALALVALAAVAAFPSLRAPAAAGAARRTRAPAGRLHALARSEAATGARTGAVPAYTGAAGSTTLHPVTGTVTVGAFRRSYEVFAPAAQGARIPALVVLHGRTASVALEESRDGLVRLAQEGRAIVVYPVGYLESWNAGACCGAARAAGIDDRTFVTIVIDRLAADPRVSSISLVGYSNGGKMAYDLVCSHPKLVGSFVVVAAVPAEACPAGPPISLLELVGTRDPLLSYDHTGPPHVVNGFTMPSVVDETAAWRHRDGCTSQASVRTTGALRLQTWGHCKGGTVVALGTYLEGGHVWPAGGDGTPSGADVLWSFITTPRATTPLPVTHAPTPTPGLTAPHLAAPPKRVPTAAFPFPT